MCPLFWMHVPGRAEQHANYTTLRKVSMNNWFLLAAIPVFGLLIFVHELGHFITAKWAGIRVEEFGLGFPPRLVGIRKRDTGGWEVIWFSSKRNAEDAYDSRTQSPSGGTSGGVSAAMPGTLTTAAGSHAFAGVRV